MRTFFSIFLGLSILVGVQHNLEAHLPWATNATEAMETAQKENKPVLILFTGGGWCTWCTKLEKEVLGTPQFERALKDQFVFLKADFPSPSESDILASPYSSLMQKYNVDGFPTLIIVNAKGEKLFIMGYETGGADKYINKLQNNLKSAQAK